MNLLVLEDEKHQGVQSGALQNVKVSVGQPYTQGPQLCSPRPQPCPKPTQQST